MGIFDDDFLQAAIDASVGASPSDGLVLQRPVLRQYVLAYLPMRVERLSEANAPRVPILSEQRRVPSQSFCSALALDADQPRWRKKPVLGQLCRWAEDDERPNAHVSQLVQSRPSLGYVHYLPIVMLADIPAGTPVILKKLEVK